jgi:hypothetical protein
MEVPSAGHSQSPPFRGKNDAFQGLMGEGAIARREGEKMKGFTVRDFREARRLVVPCAGTTPTLIDRNRKARTRRALLH